MARLATMRAISPTVFIYLRFNFWAGLSESVYLLFDEMRCLYSFIFSIASGQFSFALHCCADTFARLCEHYAMRWKSIRKISLMARITAFHIAAWPLSDARADDLFIYEMMAPRSLAPASTRRRIYYFHFGH